MGTICSQMMTPHETNDRLPLSLFYGRLRINTAAEAEHLPRFPSVVTIEILPSALNNMDTALFSRCQQLAEIVVKDYTGGVLDLRFLDNLSTLEQLKVYSPSKSDDTPTRITSSAWRLPAHPSITFMTLNGVQPEADFIRQVSTWNLDHLRFHRVNFDSSSCQLLGRVAVRLLAFDGCRLPFLPEIGDVEGLQFWDGCVVDTLDLNNLGLSGTSQLLIDLSKLVHIVCPSRPQSQLKGLVLQNLSPDHVPLLDSFPKTLKKLELWLGSIGNEYLTIIRQMHSLEELFITSAVAQLDLSLLDGHPSLRKLFVKIPNVNADPHIPRLPNIEDLSLQRDTRSSKLDHLDLSPLTNATQLTELKINDCPLSKIDLGPLSSCAGLQRLELYGNQTEEYDLTPLLHLKSLDFLLVGNLLMQNPVLFADSRQKNTIVSPEMLRLDIDDEIEWR